MKGFRTTEEDIKIKENAIELKKQFEVEFNRYYCTQRYIEAFDLCIQNLSDAQNKNFVRFKSNLVIEKLTERIILSDTSRINQDWVIDCLVKLGEENMKIQYPNIIQVGGIDISIYDNEKVYIKGSINIPLSIPLFLWSFIRIILKPSKMKPVLFIPNQHRRKLIQHIASAIVEEYYNG